MHVIPRRTPSGQPRIERRHDEEVGQDPSLRAGRRISCKSTRSRIPPGIRDRIPEIADLSDDELVLVLIESLEPQVMAAATQELSRHGQRMTKRIKGGGHVQETGAEYMTNRLGEHHATFRVAFKGDHNRAVAAATAWAAR